LRPSQTTKKTSLMPRLRKSVVASTKVVYESGLISGTGVS